MFKGKRSNTKKLQKLWTAILQQAKSTAESSKHFTKRQAGLIATVRSWVTYTKATLSFPTLGVQSCHKASWVFCWRIIWKYSRVGTSIRRPFWLLQVMCTRKKGDKDSNLLTLDNVIPVMHYMNYLNSFLVKSLL